MVWKEYPTNHRNFIEQDHHAYPQVNTPYYNNPACYISSAGHTLNEHDQNIKNNNRLNNIHQKNNTYLENNKKKLFIKELEMKLAYEAENALQNELQNKLNIDLESINSFNEFARYLQTVNPICSPDTIDTAEKLLRTLGML